MEIQDSPFGFIEPNPQENINENIIENEELEEDDEPAEIIEEKIKKRFSQTEIFKTCATPLENDKKVEILEKPIIKTIQGTPEPEEIKYELEDLKTMKNAQLKQICKLF